MLERAATWSAFTPPLTHFTEPQIVEPVFVIAFYTAVSKFGDALEPVFSEIESILHFKH